MKTQNQRVNETVNAIKRAINTETHEIIETDLKRDAIDNKFTDKQYIQYVLIINTKRKNAKNPLLDLHIFAIIGVRGAVKTWSLSDMTMQRHGKGLKKLLRRIDVFTL